MWWIIGVHDAPDPFPAYIASGTPIGCAEWMRLKIAAGVQSFQGEVERQTGWFCQYGANPEYAAIFR